MNHQQKQPKTIFFTVADDRHIYDNMLERSLKFFHPDIEFRRFGEAEIQALKDPDIFYRQKPIFADILFREGYERVIGLDADILILGSLDHILNPSEYYDVGTTLNFNPFDARTFGPVSVGAITPQEYFNAGFVIMNNYDFVKHWRKLCLSQDFYKYQYREQDLLNLICRYDESYKVVNIDNLDSMRGEAYWHNLLGKGYGLKMEMRGDNIVLPRQSDNYPSMDIVMKAIHWAGGESKGTSINYKVQFSEPVIERIDVILNGKEVVPHGV